MGAQIYPRTRLLVILNRQPTAASTPAPSTSSTRKASKKHKNYPPPLLPLFYYLHLLRLHSMDHSRVHQIFWIYSELKLLVFLLHHFLRLQKLIVTAMRFLQLLSTTIFIMVTFSSIKMGKSSRRTTSSTLKSITKSSPKTS